MQLSVSEFSNFCRNLNPKCYVFDTRNQMQHFTHSTFSASARYKIMTTSLCPNLIAFKNDSSLICFERVKYVQIDPENQTVGLVFTIVCGDRNGSSNDVLYTMIAD